MWIRFSVVMWCFNCISLRSFFNLVFVNSVIWKLCWSSSICLWALLKIIWLFWFASSACCRALFNSFAWKFNCWTWWLMTFLWTKKFFRKFQLKHQTQFEQVSGWWCLICINNGNVSRSTVFNFENLFINMFLKH